MIQSDDIVDKLVTADQGSTSLQLRLSARRCSRTVAVEKQVVWVLEGGPVGVVRIGEGSVWRLLIYDAIMLN